MAANSTELISTPLSGLTEAEVNQRRSQGLANKVPPPTGRTYVQIFRENIFTFINMVIFVLGMALVLVGRPSDALISLGVISANVLVSVVQEIRAKRTLDRIAVLTRPTAQVIRDAVPHNVLPEDLVVGDVLQVNPGDQIVLDGRVIGDGQMQVDESQLTGESNLVPKKSGDEVFSGSFCVNGSALYVAEKVGEAEFVQSDHRGRARVSPRADAAAKRNLPRRAHHAGDRDLHRVSAHHRCAGRAGQHGRDHRQRHARRGLGAQRPLPLHHAGLRVGRGTHHPVRRARAAE